MGEGPGHEPDFEQSNQPKNGRIRPLQKVAILMPQKHLRRSFQVDMDMCYFGGVVLKMCTSGEGQQKGQ